MHVIRTMSVYLAAERELELAVRKELVGLVVTGPFVALEVSKGDGLVST